MTASVGKQNMRSLQSARCELDLVLACLEGSSASEGRESFCLFAPSFELLNLRRSESPIEAADHGARMQLLSNFHTAALERPMCIFTSRGPWVESA